MKLYICMLSLKKVNNFKNYNDNKQYFLKTLIDFETVSVFLINESPCIVIITRSLVFNIYYSL